MESSMHVMPSLKLLLYLGLINPGLSHDQDRHDPPGPERSAQARVVIDLGWDFVKSKVGYPRLRGGTDKGAFSRSPYRLLVLGIAAT